MIWISKYFMTHGFSDDQQLYIWVNNLDDELDVNQIVIDF